MKLLELYIYGFGKLENVHINLSEQVQVFYGKNEAGKSTIMAFINAVLFGFPTKQQTELRYEPKLHAKYGGMLRIHHPELGFATIERVKGKAAGDVTVTLENGMSGGEELLQQLLSNMDKGIFQAIFSFNLHGLQNIHQMKKEEIGNFLFSAGTLGTDQLARTETLLKKELDYRFKPTGRNPHLNGKVQALQELKNELKKASAKNSHYEELLGKLETVQNEIASLQDEGSGIREERNKLLEWKKVQPLVIESKRVKMELGELGYVSFPLNGLEQMEKLTQLIKPYQARIISTTERIAGLKEELKKLFPDERVLKYESQIVTSIEKIPLFEQLKLEKKQWELKLDELNESVMIIQEKLHLDVTDEELLDINTNFYIKEQVEALYKKQQQLEDAKNDLDFRFTEEKESLEKVEYDWNIAKEQIFPENERHILEEQMSNGTDKRSIEIELGAVREQIEFLKRAEQQEKRKKKKKMLQRRNQLVTLGFLFMGLLLYSVLTQQMLLAAFGLIGCVLLGLFFFKGTNEESETDLNQQLESLLQRETALIMKMNSAEFMGQSALQYKLQLDNEQRERARLLQIKWEQQNEQYEKVIARFEKWETENIEHNEKLVALAKQLRIPILVAQKHLLVSFQLIEQFKKEFREKQRTIERIEKIEKEMESISQDIVELAKRYLDSFEGEDLQRASFFLREKLNAERERRVINEEKMLKLNDLQSDLQQLETERDHLQTEAQELL
ncbi:MAG: AAA family ATPase, partial [Bacillota bacterium]|nr:AAA family ATPase [Bacillota bacterium]